MESTSDLKVSGGTSKQCRWTTWSINCEVSAETKILIPLALKMKTLKILRTSASTTATQLATTLTTQRQWSPEVEQELPEL